MKRQKNWVRMKKYHVVLRNHYKTISLHSIVCCLLFVVQPFEFEHAIYTEYAFCMRHTCGQPKIVFPCCFNDHIQFFWFCATHFNCVFSTLSVHSVFIVSYLRSVLTIFIFYTRKSIIRSARFVFLVISTCTVVKHWSIWWWFISRNKTPFKVSSTSITMDDSKCETPERRSNWNLKLSVRS